MLDGVGLQDKAQFKCFEGFEIKGPSELICKDNEVSASYYFSKLLLRVKSNKLLSKSLSTEEHFIFYLQF